MLVNDADAAGVAEVHYGAAKGHPGLVLLTTLGTGIGTAILYPACWCRTPSSATSRSTATTPSRGRRRASRTRRGCPTASGPSGCRRYYEVIEELLWPDLIVVGGGVSKDSDKFLRKIKHQRRDGARQAANTAGIVGAAWLADNRATNPGLVRNPTNEMRVD